MMQALHKLMSVFVIVTTMVSVPVAAEEFRVDSKVYNGDKTTPVSESLTLFYAGRAYDLLSSPPEITIFDLAKNRIVLLDPPRKIRTEVETDQLTKFVEELRVRASRQADPVLKFSAEPKFAESVDDDGRLVFASPHMTYRVRGNRAAIPASVQAYREFADWSARLSTRVSQGAQPPFPRLAVNAALERRGWLPDEVERSTTDPNRPKLAAVTLRSQHKFEWQLYPADHKRIQEADKFAADFQLLPLDQYIRPPQQAKR